MPLEKKIEQKNSYMHLKSACKDASQTNVPPQHPGGWHSLGGRHQGAQTTACSPPLSRAEELRKKTGLIIPHVLARRPSLPSLQLPASFPLITTRLWKPACILMLG